MLVLTRRIGERLNIGTEIVVQVLGRRGNAIRLGVEAPDDVRILRDDVAERRPSDGNAEGPGA